MLGLRNEQLLMKSSQVLNIIFYNKAEIIIELSFDPERHPLIRKKFDRGHIYGTTSKCRNRIHMSEALLHERDRRNAETPF